MRLQCHRPPPPQSDDGNSPGLAHSHESRTKQGCDPRGGEMWLFHLGRVHPPGAEKSVSLTLSPSSRFIPVPVS